MQIESELKKDSSESVRKDQESTKGHERKEEFDNGSAEDLGRPDTKGHCVDRSASLEDSRSLGSGISKSSN